MRVRLQAVVLALGLLLASGVPAAADSHWRERHQQPGQPAPGQPPAGTPQPQGHLWWSIQVGQDDDGDNCWELAAERRDEPPPEERSRQFMQDRLATWDVSGVAYEACPVGIPPEAAALDLWVSLAPQGVTGIEVPPGFALAGLGTYLLFDGPGPISAETTEGGVTIRIEATPEYVVDWGDGSPEVRTTSTGVAYPGGPGEIRHVYTDAGEVTVTVSTEWRARFLVNGQPQADLPGRTVVETYDLPVQERRAVRTR